MRVRTVTVGFSALVVLGIVASQAFAAPDAAAPASATSGAAVTNAVFVVAPRVSHAANNTPAAVQALVKQAADQRAQGDYDGVIATLGQAIHIDAKNADLYADLSDALAAKGRFDDAVKGYMVAVGEDANLTWSSSRMDDGDLQIRFALLLARTGQYDLAATMYKKGYEDMMPAEKKALPSSFNPKDLKADKSGVRDTFNAASRTLLGMKYSADGYMPEATAQLEATLQGGVDYAPADYFLANCRLAAGQKSDAVALWQKAVQNGDGDVKKLAQKSLEKAQ